jgi:hypothetical protein
MNEYMGWLEQTHPSLATQLNAAGGASAARSGTDAFKTAWRTLMNDPANAETQHEYAVTRYYVPGARSIKRRTGIDPNTRSKTLQDVVWSSAVQHGPSGAARIFERAIANTGSSNPTDDALIRAVYTERAANNGSKYFGSSEPNVRASVVRRFQNELADALESLAQETEAQGTPTLQPGDNAAAAQPIGPSPNRPGENN